ncbi:MAG: hypothetical protein E6Q97_15600 [Desulfurellales bacterium]|nr:MAG: hypothetical protein E6Q97_15600 [Desulfurellales bacterium]
MTRSIGTNSAKDPEADFTIRDSIGGVSLLDRDGNVVASMRSGGRVLSLFVSGAAAAGKSVYDQRTGMYMAGTLDKLSQGLFPHGASDQ